MNKKGANTMKRGLGRFTGAAGIAMILVGLVLMGAVGAYYGYGSYARDQLDSLNYAPDVTTPLVPVSTAPLPNSPAPSAGMASQASIRSTTLLPSTSESLVDQTPNSSSSPNQASFPVSSYASVYPGTEIHPKFWNQPMWSGGEPYSYNPKVTGIQLPEGYRPISAANDVLVPGNGSNTTRISVPSIGIDSDITELQILDLGSSREYETPKNTVGHIPQSSNPGEAGNAWFFGHLESPIKGEGNVFQRLPDIPEKLRNGDEVLVELENEEGHVFLYRVTRTDVVHQDDIWIYENPGATLTLVACVPRFVYDHRILVTAELIGVDEG